MPLRIEIEKKIPHRFVLFFSWKPYEHCHPLTWKEVELLWSTRNIQLWCSNSNSNHEGQNGSERERRCEANDRKKGKKKVCVTHLM
jgi:hypothetical protein